MKNNAYSPETSKTQKAFQANTLQGSHNYTKMVSIGDSFTEGIGDANILSQGGHRGWADRLAEQLSTGTPHFTYANLAIRGKILDEIIEEQVTPALELNPDLITMTGGGNDIIRISGDPDDLAADLEQATSALTQNGATLLLLNGPDIKETPVLKLVRGKIAIYNENINTIVKNNPNIILGDMWHMKELAHSAMWADDRLHFSPLGHHAISIMAQNSLGIENDRDPMVLPDENDDWFDARKDDFFWVKDHFLPWIGRHIKGVSSGDGVSAKRPFLAPIQTPDAEIDELT